jgi:acyl-CoA synthetase (AMP-forming)/AMP-acid ligase II
MSVESIHNLGDLIRRDMDQSRLALIDLGGPVSPRHFSYADLDEKANAVARGLFKRGLKAGQRVAIVSANRAEYLFCHFGIMRAGLVSVPVNFKFPPALIEFVARDSDAALVFCDAARAQQLPEDLPKVVFDSVGASGFDSFLDPGPFEASCPEPESPGMFLYTSGSTGKPKGVVLSHHSHIWVSKTRLGSNDFSAQRFLIAAPLYHMNALSLANLSVIAHACIVMLPQFDANNYIRAIEDYQCTWLTAVPPMIAMMLQEKELVARTNFSTVQHLRMGSAPVSNSLVTSIKEVLPNVKITNAYGTTEGGPVVFGPHPEGRAQPLLSVGYPHPAAQLRLADGVLQMKSPGVMLGYHKAQSREPKLSSPFTEDGFYVTGDIFRVDEHGFYFFLGRADDMFVSGGENIYPSEVERLLETHPSVQQAAVLPLEDDIKGYKPAAFVVLKPGSGPMEEEKLKKYCLQHAPAYQHPRWIWFIEALPLASTNKIDKARLKTMACERLGAAPG